MLVNLPVQSMTLMLTVVSACLFNLISDESDKLIALGPG